MRTRLLAPSAAGVLAGACAVCVLAGLGAATAHRPHPDAGSAATRGARDAEQGDAESAGGTVGGRVTVPTGQRLPEMIVFLESADPAFAVAPPAEPVVVSLRNARFTPGLVVVPVGTRVEFRNDEERPVEHNVFSNSKAKPIDLGLSKPGTAAEPVSFDRPGAVRLRCSIHRYMEGVVYVTPTPYFARVAGDGRFSVAGVRPGAYRLKTWQRSPRYRERDVPVTVAAGEAAGVNVEMSR